MGNCCESCELYRKPQKNITLLVLGLDHAGKTTMAKRLAGEPVDSILKTLGFSLVVLRHHSYQINLYDLGGSAQIRGIWSKYFMDAHGIIYMVDSSDMNRLDETKRIFIDLLSHENVSGKPILLLANKQDRENALDELEIIDQLDVERIVNRYRCLTRVEICSALTLEKNKMDIGIKNGFRWLIENIIANYRSLNERVQHDMTEFASKVQQDREAWKARVETNETSDACGDVAIENGNPFHPIDQVIRNINGRVSSKQNINKMCNGVAVKKVLIDNYVREELPSDYNIPDFTVKRKEESNILDLYVNDSHKNRIPDFTVKTNSAKSQSTTTTNGETSKRPYSKYKRRFARFNKTAPMPIDVLMRENATRDSKPCREVSKYSIESDFGFVHSDQPEPRSRNYLTRRPATAPSKFNFSAITVNTVWDLDISGNPDLRLSAR